MGLYLVEYVIPTWYNTNTMHRPSYNVDIIQRYTPITVDQTASLYNIIIIILYDTILRQKRNFKHEK